jgi:hypothetical protein
MAFTLNFGKGDGTGSSGFGKKASAAIDKCKSMAPYMGTLQDNLTGGVEGGAGTPEGFSGNYGSPNNMNVPGPTYSSMANQNDNTYVETTEEEGFLSGVTRGGKRPEVGDAFNSDNESRNTSTRTEVTDQNNSSNLTRVQKGKGVKVKRKINTIKKDDRQYYPENHPKAGQIKP